MTYNVGQIIENETYNAFSASMNEVFADTHPGATTLPDAGFGYGQIALPTTIADGQIIRADEWNKLFSAMRNCGTHQGTTGVVPPLPNVGLPVPGNIIAAVTSEVNFNSIITTLKTNKFNVAGGHLNSVVDITDPHPTPWINTITFTFTYDFGSWDNARYFFNTGGSIDLNGTYAPTPPASPDELAWQDALVRMSPLRFNYTTTTPRLGGNEIVSPAGFYGLTNVVQTIYKKFIGEGTGPYYTTNFIEVTSRLLDPAGTSGKIAFAIRLTDADTFPETKDGTLTYSTTSNRSIVVSGAGIAYLGPVGSVSNGYVST